MTASRLLAAPCPFRPADELPEDGEPALAAEILDTMLGISDATHAHSGNVLRPVHAKSHGLLRVSLHVPPGLPPPLAQGLFAQPAVYRGVARLSTIPGDVLDDAVSTPRGFALKLVGVPGRRLEDMEGSTTQDLVMVDTPQFNARDGRALLRALKLVALTTDRAEGAKKALSAVMRRLEQLVEAFGGESAGLKALGGQPPRHPLSSTYFTQLPMRHGDFIAKYRLRPISRELLELGQARIDLGDGANPLRDAVVAFFQHHGAEWALEAQLQRDRDRMPVDDPRATWSEDESPFLPVARLSAEPQQAWSAERAARIDERMGFNPWRGLAAHQPLGQLMRLRRVAYAGAQAARARRLGLTSLPEPATATDLPD